MNDTGGRPFDDIRRLLATAAAGGGSAEAPDVDDADDVEAWVARCRRKPKPEILRGLVCLFASTHGAVVAREAEPGVTVAAGRARLDRFGAGGTLLNAVCAQNGLGFKAFDLALDLPTEDVTRAAAADERGCVATMAFGMESLAGGADLVVLGHASEGTDALASACLSALWGDGADRWVDPDDRDAAALVLAALARHRGETEVAGDDPLAILASLGGRDLAAIAGAIVAARHERVPVLLDGYAALAAAALLGAIDPTILAGCRPGALGPHPRHAELASRLGTPPILAGLAVGRAAGGEVGSALAAGLLKTLLAARKGLPQAA